MVERKSLNKVKVEVQYFSGCPNSQSMLERVREAINQASIEVDFKETLVETPEEADEIKFRGSPTLLINEKDFEDLLEPGNGNLSCRYYPKGLPTTVQILDQIKR